LRHRVLEDLIAATGELPTLPATVVDLLALLNDSTASVASVQKVIERDPAMTANILKLCNSAFYGARRQISSVRDALVMLGNRSVAALAFATGMAPILRRDLLGYGFGRDQFWNHSLLAGATASRLTDRLGCPEYRCEAFTAGLVHDLGMLIVDPLLVSRKIVLVVEDPRVGVRGAEQEVLGFDHCDAGALLAEAWGFPEILVKCIRNHHDPAAENQWPEVVRAVDIGNRTAQSLVEFPEGEFSDALVAALLDDGLDEAIIAQLRLDLTDNLPETLALATGPVGSPV